MRVRVGWRTVAALAVGVLVTASCGGRSDTATAAGAARDPQSPRWNRAVQASAAYTLADHTITGPGELPAGATRVSATNTGVETHHLVFVRLEPGKTPEDLPAAFVRLDPNGVATLVGGPTSVAPGATVTATVALEPGRYVLVCLVPGRDGVSHYLKGMSAPLTVTESDASTALPPADRTIHLGEFSIGRGSRDLVGFRPTGTVRVLNEGAQLHELSLVRLKPGRSLEDVVQVASTPMGRPRPDEPWTSVGGVSLLTPGRSAVFDFADLRLTPGRYALVCFIPSPDDRVAHAAKGMTWTFNVRR